MGYLKFLNSLVLFISCMSLIGCAPPEPQIEFKIKNQPVEQVFSFAEYCEVSGLMDNESEEAEIDIEEAAAFMVKQAKKEKIGTFDAEDVRWIVDGQLEYWETQE